MQFFQAMNQILHPFLKPISYEFFLGALASSRQQILHHFKVPPLSDGNKSFAIASRFLKAMATNPLPFLQGFLKAIATNLLSFLQGFLKAMASLGNLLKGS
jgi:hypothetical protein